MFDTARNDGDQSGPAPEDGSSRLERLGDLVHRRRTTILIGAVIALVGLAAVAAGAMSSFVLNRWEAPGSESVAAHTHLQQHFDTGNANLILLVTATGGDIDSPEVAAAATAVARDLAGQQAVGDVWSYWSRPGDPTLRSADGGSALVLAHVTGDATAARAAITGYIEEFTVDDDVVDVRVAGSEAASAQISDQALRDFVRAEMLIVPLMLVLLTAIYRRFTPALLTLGVGLFSVVATLAALRGVAGLVEIASFAANIVLVMGIGLGVDYGLFLIVRFRQSLARGSTTHAAVRETLDTAGRTVLFSAVTVLASVLVLVVLPFPFLRSFAYAGAITVVTATIAALVVLPAALAVLADRARGRGRIPRPQRPVEQGRWFRLGERVVRRPLIWGGAALVVLLAISLPALDVRIGAPDDRVLAQGSSVRDTYDALRQGFGTEPHDALHVVDTAGGATAQDVADYAAALSRVPGVAQVNSADDVFVAGEPTSDGYGNLRAGQLDRLEVVPLREATDGTDSSELVAQIRAVPSPFQDTLVGGYPAQLADFRAVLLDRLPLVVALIVASTLVILFLLTGSVLLPVKALVMNLLSIAVMFGTLVAVFQNGLFADLLGFTPVGSLDPAFPILMFCVVYGLSMDYEVFMVSRIREEHEAGGDDTYAVLAGLQRSAPLISAAALTLALSFGLYATGSVMYLQMIGIGVAVAIVVDATVVRAVLVPAFMALAGRWNWWSPRIVRPIVDRFGFRETAAVSPRRDR